MSEIVEKRLELRVAGGFEKFVAGGKRRIRGVASTDSVDRMGDIVDPAGATWKTPFPLLLQHDHKKPIGRVLDMQQRGNGLWIEAEVAEGVGESDDAWKMIEAGLITSYSIGFRALESERLSTGGLRFTKSEIYEVSIVTVPANADAVIERRAGAAESASAPAPAPVVKIGLEELGAAGIRTLSKEMAGSVARVIKPLEKRIEALEQKASHELDPELFGAAVGKAIREKIAPIIERLDGMQAKLDKAMSFAGDWQPVLDYRPGSAVRAGNSVFVAMKTIKAGGGEPARAGSGWIRII